MERGWGEGFWDLFSSKSCILNRAASASRAAELSHVAIVVVVIVVWTPSRELGSAAKTLICKRPCSAKAVEYGIWGKNWELRTQSEIFGLKLRIEATKSTFWSGGLGPWWKSGSAPRAWWGETCFCLLRDMRIWCHFAAVQVVPCTEGNRSCAESCARGRKTRKVWVCVGGGRIWI